MTRAGVAIHKLELKRKVNSEIAIESFAGLVPEFECREAAVFGHYNWTQWLRLTDYEKAAVVAHYRTHLTIDAHISDAAERASKRARRGKK